MGSPSRRPPARPLPFERLDALANGVRDRLRHLGVGRGDRVGICCPKSIDGVAAILGILKAGAAYVPCDPHAPAVRNAYILGDCAVKLAVIEEGLSGKRLSPSS